MGSKTFLQVYHMIPSDFAERRSRDKRSCLSYNRKKKKGGITMFESILYLDPQAAKPARFCPRCGGECYPPGLVCIRCEQKKGRGVKKAGGSVTRPCIFKE